MLDEKIRMKISAGEGLGMIKDRAPQRPARQGRGWTLISSDSHYPLTEDIWHGNTRAALKDRMPRIWWDEEAGIYQLGLNHKPMFPPSAFALIRSMEDLPGARRFDLRMKDLDAEGISAEIVYPQVLAIFFKYPDFEVREELFRIYNEHIASLQRREPKRFFPVAIPNYWDPSKAAASVHRIAELGLKSVMIPMVPGPMPDGRSTVWNTDEWDPLWRAAEETGLPINVHIGEGFLSEGLNGEGPRLMHDIGSSMFRKIFGQFVFGLIFDRFPKLKLVFSEAGIHWVPGALQDAEMICNSHGRMFESLPRHRPSHYWHENCYATFMADPSGLRQLDVIGADRVMWSVDYPHNEGTFGYTQDVVRDVVAAAGEESAGWILSETCRRVYRLD